MLKSLRQIIILIFLFSGLALFQFSLISALPDPFRQFNLILIVLTFTLFFLDFRIALIAAFISGFWLDLLAFNFFGFYLLIFFSTLVLAQWILKNWLTNRSFYTLLTLMVGLTIFYNILVATILYLLDDNRNVFFIIQARFWITLVYQLIWSFISALVLFNLAALISKRIKPFFLEKKSFI
jgi:cell shape-determining protein MreD